MGTVFPGNYWLDSKAHCFPTSSRLGKHLNSKLPYCLFPGTLFSDNHRHVFPATEGTGSQLVVAESFRSHCFQAVFHGSQAEILFPGKEKKSRRIMVSTPRGVTRRALVSKEKRFWNHLYSLLAAQALKGSLTWVFWLKVFLWISFPLAPEYPMGAIWNFYENSRRYSQLCVYRRCQDTDNSWQRLLNLAPDFHRFHDTSN
jgi:hypothetical protein